MRFNNLNNHCFPPVVLFGCFRILPGAVITASVSKHAKKQHFGKCSSFIIPFQNSKIHNFTHAYSANYHKQFEKKQGTKSEF